jgi:small-conductance mechanosensitive channel
MNVKDLLFSYGITGFKALFIFVVGFFFIKILASFAERNLNKYHSDYLGMVAGKLIYYVGLFLIVMTALSNFGINTTQLLGAAGVFGVAIGFASQTSVSNIISGIFLIAEKPFVVGDWLQVGAIKGKVSDIDLLSIKLVTADNEYIRIPNEYLVKNSFVNMTKFKLRRISVKIGVSYRQDLSKVLHLLNQVIAENELNKNREKSLSVVTSFDESVISLTAYMWVSSTQIIASKSSLLKDIKQKFEQEHIEIPFPQIVVHRQD